MLPLRIVNIVNILQCQQQLSSVREVWSQKEQHNPGVQAQMRRSSRARLH